MEQDPINPTEQALIETMLQFSIQQINSIIPHADHIHRQRLTYFLIETRRAAYKALCIKKTMLNVLSEFDVSRPTYDDWYSKWHRFLPSNVKILLETK
jgi:hypothetical protein